MDALHDRLICEVETAVAESPVGVEGAVVSAPAITVTVIFCVAVPPAPVHASVNVVLAVTLVIACEPDVAFVPVHPPLAVQEVALVELHDNVAEPPEVTDVGDAERVRVGVGAVYLVRKSSTLHPSAPVS